MYPVRAPKSSGINVDALLLPISGDDSCGEPLRYEGTYDQIRAARQEDDPVLERGVWKIPLKRADWGEVARLCEDALATRSKDLQVAAWLLEAWLHQHGFSGLQQGLRLMAALCDVFWEGLHPRPEGDDLEYRTSAVVWVDEKIPVVIKLLPLTQPQSDDLKTYCWADWESACRARAGVEAPTQAEFQQSAMMTPTKYFEALLADVEGAMDGCQSLEETLELYCGREAPSLRQLFGTLEPIRGLIISFLHQRRGEMAANEPLEEQQDDPLSMSAAWQPEDTGSPEPGPSFGPIRNRSEAYRRLSEAADYLARTEPHSPVSYLVRRAISWGSMNLEEVLGELVRDGNQLQEIGRLLQMTKKPGK